MPMLAAFRNMHGITNTFAVLCCAVLCCAVLCCAVLCCTLHTVHKHKSVCVLSAAAASQIRLVCILCPALFPLQEVNEVEQSNLRTCVFALAGDRFGKHRRACLLRQLSVNKHRKVSSVQGAEQAHAHLQAAVHHARTVCHKHLPSQLVGQPAWQRTAAAFGHR